MENQAANLLVSAHLYGTRKKDAVGEGVSAGPALTRCGGTAPLIRPPGILEPADITLLPLKMSSELGQLVIFLAHVQEQ